MGERKDKKRGKWGEGEKMNLSDVFFFYLLVRTSQKFQIPKKFSQKLLLTNL